MEGYTKEFLANELEDIGVKKDDTLLVHSSMKALGDVCGGANTVLDALLWSVKDGMLVLPTHTWATMSNEHSIYDSLSEPACVGILPNLFMKRTGVKRSLHPTHSLAAYSADEEKLNVFLDGEEEMTTPCSRNGCYGKLYDLDAKILLLGVGLNRNTYMHGVEEWFGIKERLTCETLNLQIKMPDDSLKSVKMHKHFKPDGISVSEYYAKLYEPLLDRGALVKGKIGDADVMLLSAVKTADIMTEYLKADRDYFLSM